jgi:hypothetical protein
MQPTAPQFPATEHAHEYDTKLVEVFIGRLRKKIGDPPLIHTVRHVGYTMHSYHAFSLELGFQPNLVGRQPAC